MPSPIPCPAPVTIATFPSSRIRPTYQRSVGRSMEAGRPTDIEQYLLDEEKSAVIGAEPIQGGPPNPSAGAACPTAPEIKGNRMPHRASGFRCASLAVGLLALLVASPGWAAAVAVTTCGQVVEETGYLTADLDCSAWSGPAVILVNRAKLLLD